MWFLLFSYFIGNISVLQPFRVVKHWSAINQVYIMRVLSWKGTDTILSLSAGRMVSCSGLRSWARATKPLMLCISFELEWVPSKTDIGSRGLEDNRHAIQRLWRGRASVFQPFETKWSDVLIQMRTWTALGAGCIHCNTLSNYLAKITDDGDNHLIPLSIKVAEERSRRRWKVLHAGAATEILSQS